ncbi:MAG: hypothetical protein K2F55_03745, partial [Erysipelotrichaceae bacterium]|nr:hypothetical protein [Erysipelotrichaceae bacterium]
MKSIKNRYQKLIKQCGIVVLILFTLMSTFQLPIKANSIIQPISEYKIRNTGARVGTSDKEYKEWYDGVSKLKVNEEIVFCVEPLVLGLKGTYYPGDFDYETQERLSLIVYYGWDTTAKNDIDYAVTQYMVWEALGAKVLQWYGSFGNIYPALKAKVQEKIDRHDVKPSFDNGTYEVNLGDTLSLTDNNHIINDFYIKNNGGAAVWIDGNQLHIMPNEDTPDEITITLQKALDMYVGASIAYRSSHAEGQDVGLFKLSDPVRTTINIKVHKYGNIQATKVDKDTIVAHGDATLQGAVYGLYANEDIVNKTTGEIIHAKDSLLETRTVDENGNMAPFEKIRIGEYYLKEIQAPQGYLLSDEKVVVQIIPNDTVNVTVEDEIKRGKFSVSKGIAQTDNSEIMKPEVGAEFITVLKKYVEQYGSVEEAYKHRDTFASDEWDLLVTNNTGYAQSKELAYGTYVSKQIKGELESVLLEETWETVIDGDINNEKHYIIKNQIFQPYLKIVKKDIETGEIVSFPAGGVYKVRNVDTGEFLTQKVGNQYISEFQTKNGYVVLPLKINPGKYELIEVKAPDGYLIDETPIPFTITQSNIHETDQDGDPVYVVEISNQRVKGQIEVQKYGKALTKFENGQFIYEERSLAGAEFTLYAREDIKDPATGAVVYPKDSEITKVVSDATGVARFDN